MPFYRHAAPTGLKRFASDTVSGQTLSESGFGVIERSFRPRELVLGFLRGARRAF